MGSSPRRIARLTLDNLGDLPVPCRECGYWELDPVEGERATAAGAAADGKEAWVSRVLLEWGSCGRIAYVDGRPAGYALYAPPHLVPRSAAFPTSPPSDDAVLLTSLMVRPEYGGGGLGRVLVQEVVKDLLNRGGIRALEAFGDRRPPTDGLTGCVIPADFLVRVGFKTQRNHPRFPRLRMDLRTVLTWREEVEHALEKLIEVVRPRPRPRPAPATERNR